MAIDEELDGHLKAITKEIERIGTRVSDIHQVSIRIASSLRSIALSLEKVAKTKEECDGDT